MVTEISTEVELADEPVVGTTLLCELKCRLDGLAAQIERSHVYGEITDPEADPKLVRLIMKNVFLEIFHYQPHCSEATFTAVGRMPKDDELFTKAMILQQVEEITHCEMALRDFVRLGGDECAARAMRPSSASTAAIAVMRYLADHESPTCYLGYMYLFETLTPVIAEKIAPALAAKEFPECAREFFDFHAREDIRHSRWLSNLVNRTAAKIPGAEEAILYGFDSFAAVYPIPIWMAAFQRARTEMS